MNKVKSFIWQIPPEEFRESVNQSKCFADLARIHYGKATNIRTLKTRIKKDNIDISHFIGQTKFKGLKRPENSHPHYKLQDLLSWNETHKINNSRMKEKLIDTNTLFNQCYICGLFEWQGKPLTLQLVHLNRDSYDNRLDNLVLLCPNCFSQVKQGEVVLLNTCDCGIQIPKTVDVCKRCDGEKVMKRPTKERLQKELMTVGFDGVVKKYKVDKDVIIEWINL